jgi:hypothetical protein
MPSIKKEKNKKIFKKKNKLESTFLERPLPESEEVSQFEEAIKKEVLSEEVDNNLSVIYSDKKGELVDVSKVKKKKRLALIVFFKNIFVLTIVASALYGAYYFYFEKPAGADSLVLEINAPERVSSGEPMAYDISYNNTSGLILSDVRLEVILPNSFVITESVPPASGINSWSLGTLNPGDSGRLSISGYLVAPVDSANVIVARLNYTPSNFSSEFKKEVSANTVMANLGFLISLDYLNTVLVEKNNELKLNLSNFKDNYLSDLYLQIEASDNLKINKSEFEPYPDYEDLSFSSLNEKRWLISGLPFESVDRFSFPINLTFLEKLSDSEDLHFSLIKKEADAKELILWERSISLEAVKSDLNLSLTLNEQKTDQAVDFSSSLDYSLEYTNNGEATLYDLVLMAVVKGNYIEWSSLRDPLGGSVASNAIVWTKEHLPVLAELAPGESGKINFSLDVKDFSLADLSSDNSITSYAQYSFNNQEDVDSEDNRSNTIITYLNSDLSLTEKIVYFNEDNMPVGSGPLPPRVNEKTSLRVYWTVKNNLHDLEQTSVHMTLPTGVEWSDLANTNVGNISYDNDSRVVTWKLGYLPLSVYRADAEFNISITPAESDRDKILVISSGSVVKAIDSVTKAEISRKIKAKTTRLEDDEIAGLSNNGRVE